MTPARADADLTAIARRTIWFESPEKALTDRPRFLAWQCVEEQ